MFLIIRPFWHEIYRCNYNKAIIIMFRHNSDLIAIIVVITSGTSLCRGDSLRAPFNPDGTRTAWIYVWRGSFTAKMYSFKMPLPGANRPVRSFRSFVSFRPWWSFPLRPFASLVLARRGRSCSHNINAPSACWENIWCAHIYNFALACHRSVSFPIELSCGKNIHHTRHQWRVERTHHPVRPTWLKRPHNTIHRVNDNSPPLTRGSAAIFALAIRSSRHIPHVLLRTRNTILIRNDPKLTNQTRECGLID